MTGMRQRSGDWLVRAGEVVGDLGNPFYAEERQRDVWNEAAAVGLQVTLWLTLLAATGAVWAAGEPAVPYAVSALAVLGVASLSTLAYAALRGVTVGGADQLLRPRLLPYLVVVALLVTGIRRATPDEDSFASGFATGAGLGAAAAVVALVIAALWSRRQESPGREG